MQYYSYVREHLRTLVDDHEAVGLEGKLDQVVRLLQEVPGEDAEEESASAGGYSLSFLRTAWSSLDGLTNSRSGQISFRSPLCSRALCRIVR